MIVFTKTNKVELVQGTIKLCIDTVIVFYITFIRGFYFCRYLQHSQSMRFILLDFNLNGVENYCCLSRLIEMVFSGSYVSGDIEYEQ